MDELVKQVSAKTGISEEQTRSAVTTVITFLKGKLPAAIAGQIDNALSGEGGIGSNLSDAAAKAGGLFNK